ncbi:MAG: hypothetical protein Q8K86_09120 [Candidatus Nanopelagicaceae bacterium]|nr:hypothetical protein [Candidatus Nanopelagicaceae bacterium]
MDWLRRWLNVPQKVEVTVVHRHEGVVTIKLEHGGNVDVRHQNQETGRLVVAPADAFQPYNAGAERSGDAALDAGLAGLCNRLAGDDVVKGLGKDA